MLMHSRPPIGTLFPYTTLFRSRVSEAGPGAAEEGPGGRLDAADWSRPVVGVLGGLGPAATSVFLDVLIRATVAGSDQEHLDLLVSQHSTTPDRTAGILDPGAPDPGPVIVRDAVMLQRRSEERRVGKECRSRWWAKHEEREEGQSSTWEEVRQTQ